MVAGYFWSYILFHVLKPGKFKWSKLYSCKLRNQKTDTDKHAADLVQAF